MNRYERDLAALLEAYAGFANVDYDDLREAYLRRRELINQEWRDMPARNWEDKATRFYGQSRHYHLELLASGPTADYEADKLDRLGLGDYVESEMKIDALELGPGLGFAAEVMFQSGHAVTLVDVPGKVRDFADWRLRSRGVIVRWVSPAEMINDPATYDLIYSDAVLEHLVDPYGVAVSLCARLRPSGVLHCGIDIVNRGLDWPMHRWVDLERLDAELAAVGVELVFRSDTGVVSRWRKTAP